MFNDIAMPYRSLVNANKQDREEKKYIFNVVGLVQLKLSARYNKHNLKFYDFIKVRLTHPVDKLSVNQ